MRSFVRGFFAAALVATAIVGGVTAYTDAQAACKMRPQCSVNTDCDSICGAGLGRCVHSQCPIRICKCS